MRRVAPWLARNLPAPIYDNLIVILGITALVVLALGFSAIHNAQVNAANAAKEAKVLAASNAKLTRENQRRITEIQESRVQSCAQTYQAIIDAFMPIVREQVKSGTQTEQQRGQAQEFFRGLRNRQKSCAKQVGANVGTPP